MTPRKLFRGHWLSHHASAMPLIGALVAGVQPLDSEVRADLSLGGVSLRPARGFVNQIRHVASKDKIPPRLRLRLHFAVHVLEPGLGDARQAPPHVVYDVACS